MRLIIAAAFASLFIFSSCAKDEGSPVSADSESPGTPSNPIDSVSFANDILPLFTMTYGCTGCHGGQNKLFLESYAHATAGNSDHGPVILPGNGTGSILVKKLRTATLPFGKRMPYGGGEVSDVHLQKIIAWIDQGAKNN